MIKHLALGTAIALLAACGPTTTEPASEPAEEAAAEPAAEAAPEAVAELTVVAENGFVIEPIAGRDITMGGVDISVTGEDVRLVNANADFAAAIELHTMSMEDGQMQMRQVEGFGISDGDTFQLERGGNHLMFFGVEGLTAGETQTIELVFETGTGDEKTVSFEAAVRAIDE